MSRTLVVLAAVSGLMMSTAFAQAPQSSSPALASPAASTSSQVVPAQSADEWLASKLKGTAVIGSDDQKIGDISDFLFDKMGHVKAFIVSAGGVLGIGAHVLAPCSTCVCVRIWCAVKSINQSIFERGPC